MSLLGPERLGLLEALERTGWQVPGVWRMAGGDIQVWVSAEAIALRAGDGVLNEAGAGGDPRRIGRMQEPRAASRQGTSA